MHTESCPSVKLSGELDASAALNNTSVLEDDLALSSSTLGPPDKSLQDQTDHVPCGYNPPDRVVYVNEDTMDCNYSESTGTPGNSKSRTDVSSPEMFGSDDEEEDREMTRANEFDELAASSAAGRPKREAEERPTDEELVAKSDCYLLARMNKFLTGVPPPPKHTICQSDCSDLLAYIYANREYFVVDPLGRRGDERLVARVESPARPTEQPAATRNLPTSVGFTSLHPTNGRSLGHHRAKSSLRNLTNAFDACDRSNESTTSGKEEQPPPTASSDNSASETRTSDTRVVDEARKDGGVASVEQGEWSLSGSQTTSVASCSEIGVNRDGGKHVTFKMPEEDRAPFCSTITVDEVECLEYSIAYKHKTHGIHYNRSKTVEEFEGLTMKLCQRYIGAETQSSCNIWFTKQAPPSVKKRNLLARRANGQSPGKRLSHLARRRRTFSSANLQVLGMPDKKQLVLNIKKPTIRKGKSPRGKSPRGSAKKRGVRPSPSPRKSKLETSKRALFQSPPNDRAGPSRTTATLVNTNPQRIKRALFSTSKTKEETSSGPAEAKKTATPFEESRKRKNEDDLEGPRFKWAKSLSFDCAHGIESSSADSWTSERHSTGSFLLKSDATVQQGKCELSETHRKKLLWAVAEALRSKGIGLGHPRFKQCASQLARTVKKYMPDLENRNLPRKPGSTSDRMLKLAKHHVLLVVEAKPAE